VCARFTLAKSPWLTARKLGTKSIERALDKPRYNVAPTQPITVILNDADRTVDDIRWGLVPPSAESPAAMKLSTFNARIETIAKAPTYRDPFRATRCAIFADGFYEWRADADGGKTPMWIHRKDNATFVFAGLWDVWHGDGETVRSATIVTQPANAFMETIHSRMPVVLDTDHANAWLAEGERDPNELLAILQRCHPELVEGPPRHAEPDEGWTAHPVAPRVGNARFDDAALITAVEDAAVTTPTLFDLSP
jgi:putative SOS response-associated peptidase YedK